MQNRAYRKAFTLVELAIVVTIIGLLIGGVLKGQELMQNARIVAQVKQIREFQTAVTSFRSFYKALPGDILRPGDFIPGCNASPCTAGGNGDGFIAQSMGYPLTLINNWVTCWGNTLEGRTFWLHLATAGLISGVDTSGTWTGSGTSCGSAWGIEAPRSAIDPAGGFHVASYAITDSYLNLNGLYFLLQNSASEVLPANATLLHPTIALKLDLKMDDGKGLTGDIVTFNYGPNSCATTAGVYYVDFTGTASYKGCSLAINAVQ